MDEALRIIDGYIDELKAKETEENYTEVNDQVDALWEVRRRIREAMSHE
jgi:hypothetical protein